MSETRHVDSDRRTAAPIKASSTTVGWAALIAVWLLWGSTYDAIRVGVQEMPPLLMAGTRYLIAGAILLPIATRGRRPDERPYRVASWRTAAITGGLMLFGGNGLVSVSEQTLPAGIAALLVATVPLWLVVLDAILARRMIRPVIAAGLVLGFAGVAVLVHPTASQRLDVAGVVLVLIASAAWAAGSLYSRKAPQPRRPFITTGMQMLAGGLILLVAGTVTGEWAHLNVGHWSWSALLALAWLILPGSIVALTAYVYALRALPTSTVSTYAYVNPVIAVLIAWPLLGEHPSAQTAVAGVIIVAAVALILRAGGRH